jgi:hypothetical protein
LGIGKERAQIRTLVNRAVFEAVEGGREATIMSMALVEEVAHINKCTLRKVFR